MYHLIRALFVSFMLMFSYNANADWDWFGGNDCPPWEYDCNDWPEWSPMYWMEEMSDEFDDNDDDWRYGGRGYGGPYGGGPYGPPPMPYGGGYGAPYGGGLGPYGPPPMMPQYGGGPAPYGAPPRMAPAPYGAPPRPQYGRPAPKAPPAPK